MSISLIIAVYKRLDFLSLVLQSIGQQSFRDFEVIIAEDDNDKATVEFLDQMSDKYSFPITHVFQEDRGFRKNRILNKAVRNANSEKLVFVDGDCILHRHFLKQYDKGIKYGTARAGRRIELNQKQTNQLIESDKLSPLNPFSIIFNNAKYPEKAFYLPKVKMLNSGFKHLLGCNWGIDINDLQSINGFDEDYELSGVGEDSDIEWRLLKAGIKIESIVQSALQYHLYHPVHYNQKILDINLKLMEQKQKTGLVFCENGLQKKV